MALVRLHPGELGPSRNTCNRITTHTHQSLRPALMDLADFFAKAITTGANQVYNLHQSDVQVKQIKSTDFFAKVYAPSAS